MQLLQYSFGVKKYSFGGSMKSVFVFSALSVVVMWILTLLSLIEATQLVIMQGFIVLALIAVVGYFDGKEPEALDLGWGHALIPVAIFSTSVLAAGTEGIMFGSLYFFSMLLGLAVVSLASFFIGLSFHIKTSSAVIPFGFGN